MGTALLRRFRYCRPPCLTVPRRKKDVMGTALFRRFRYCRPPCLTVPQRKNDVMGTALLRRFRYCRPPCLTVPRRKKDVMGTALLRRFRYCRPPCQTVPRRKKDVMGTALLRRFRYCRRTGGRLPPLRLIVRFVGFPLRGSCLRRRSAPRRLMRCQSCCPTKLRSWFISTPHPSFCLSKMPPSPPGEGLTLALTRRGGNLPPAVPEGAALEKRRSRLGAPPPVFVTAARRA